MPTTESKYEPLGEPRNRYCSFCGKLCHAEKVVARFDTETGEPVPGWRYTCPSYEGVQDLEHELFTAAPRPKPNT